MLSYAGGREAQPHIRDKKPPGLLRALALCLLVQPPSGADVRERGRKHGVPVY